MWKTITKHPPEDNMHSPKMMDWMRHVIRRYADVDSLPSTASRAQKQVLNTTGRWRAVYRPPPSLNNIKGQNRVFF